MVYTISKFFCLSLPTAGLIFGFGSFICSIGEFIGLIMVIILLVCSPEDEIEEEIGYDKANPPMISSPTKITIRLILSIFNLICSFLLIIGIKRKSHKMIIPWLASLASCLMILTSISLMSIIMGFKYTINSKEGGTNVLTAGIVLSIFSVFLCYCWIAVYSLFDNFRKNHQEPLIEGDASERLNCTSESPDISIMYNNSRIDRRTFDISDPGHDVE